MEVGIRGVSGGGHQRCKVEAICSIHVVDFMYLFIYSIVPHCVGICLLHMLKVTHFICFVTINSAIDVTIHIHFNFLFNINYN